MKRIFQNTAAGLLVGLLLLPGVVLIMGHTALLLALEVQNSRASRSKKDKSL